MSFTATQQWAQLQHTLSDLNLSLQNTDNFRFNKRIDGAFSVKEIYNLQQSYPKQDSPLFPVWQLKIPPRMKIFIWQLAQNRIATLDNLKKRGWVLANRCILCFHHEESVTHIFNQCAFFQQCRQKALQRIDTFFAPPGTSSIDFILGLNYPKSHREVLAILSFIVWRERCSRIFRETSQPIISLVEQALMEWRSLQSDESS
ncbi:hypothetical protein LUZ61_019594 [Rhynchospora tenuis]|uniref:Reverse transcriptase zinc-binding domain-containing protein n=1 Tax=Rhynchospora tenuis TaxID=198213 RepID=A0AAD5ZBF7_9POAL|nr:hypothetical protein LUZ61_019594 [Rhynchospora tenuis]